MSTIRELLREASAHLQATSPTPRLDAELLLAHVLGWSRARLLAEGAATVGDAERSHFAALLTRRENLEPVAYLTGSKEFYGLDLAVDRRVLVPRPETELLVERAIAWAATRPGPLQVADIGTGSGAIAIALALALPQASILAVDRSPDALEVARTNVARHGLSQRVQLLQGDLLAPLPKGTALDILVSNPPYTVLGEIDPGVYRHEPHLALDGGPDGLAVYRRLLAQAPGHLRRRGLVLLELGAGQHEAVAALARRAFPNAEVRLYPDLAGIERVLEATLEVRG